MKMQRMHRPAILLLGAALAAGVVAACGDDDDDDGGEQAATAGGSQKAFTVTLFDYEITPPDPTFETGTRVTFDVQNAGDVTHSLEVEGPEGEVELDRELPPGSEGREMIVEFSEPGTYRWYCPVGDHADRGMEGEITVE
jgi:uncharacterized cupredoxin-like copper-binding protein